MQNALIYSNKLDRCIGLAITGKWQKILINTHIARQQEYCSVEHISNFDNVESIKAMLKHVILALAKPSQHTHTNRNTTKNKFLKQHKMQCTFGPNSRDVTKEI